jgi:hypothetical protein
LPLYVYRQWHTFVSWPVGAGVPLAGAIRDQTGSYNSAFLLFMVLLAMSLLLLPAIRHPDRSQAVVVK